MDNPTFEIVLRVKDDPDYCSFEIDDVDVDLHDLECMICDMLFLQLNRIFDMEDWRYHYGS